MIQRVANIPSTRLQALYELAGSISPNQIDLNDDRTNYLLNKIRLS